MTTLNTVLHASPIHIQQLIRGITPLSPLPVWVFFSFLCFKKAGQAGVHTRIREGLGKDGHAVLGALGRCVAAAEEPDPLEIRSSDVNQQLHPIFPHYHYRN